MGCTINKYIFIKLLFYFGFILYAILNIAKAQPCSGSWALQNPITAECVTGQCVGCQNGSTNPAGCPINPVYVGSQTNTFTFTQPVTTFSIDLRGFDGSLQCPRIEIKINGIFYPLTVSNLFDIPPGSSCTGSFSSLAITTDGYITIGSFSPASAQGRIIITNVNANNVTISTNDGNGTTFSNPFNCTTVPLKLESFTGQSNVCNVLLNWKTGIEQNVKNIEIQRSEDGVIFNKVGSVNPKGSNSRYSIIVVNSTNAYFRLKFNDFDGYYEYSNILSIKSNCRDLAYQLVPNPANNSLEILGLDNDDKIFVLDILGRKVMILNSSQNNNKFNLQSLTPGMYILQVINNGKIKSNQKLIKN